MAITLYSAIIPSYRQIVGSITRLIDKAEAYCAANGLPPQDLLEARLAEDMLPFANQVRSVALHSFGAIEGVRRGLFTPDTTPPPASFDACRDRLTRAEQGLAAITPEEMDGFVGRDMRFEAGERRMDFLAEDFLFSFSQPNLYFHAATAYGILRLRGLDIGKRDFIRELRLKA